MKKFIVLYLAPAAVIDEWQKTPAETRKAAEQKMQADWKAWMGAHRAMFADLGAGVGKTKSVSAEGTADKRNDVMLYSIVQAESHADAAKAFEGHPHLQIPRSTIEISEINPLTGM